MGEGNIVERGSIKTFFPNDGCLFPEVTDECIFFAETLKDEEDVQKAKSFMDVYCGSGFLGHYFAEHSETLSRIIFIDTDNGSINTALAMYILNNGLDYDQLKFDINGSSISMIGRCNQALEFRLGGLDQDSDIGSVEVMASFPPYIPAICEPRANDYGRIMQAAKNLGAILYLGHSSCSNSEVVEASQKKEMMREVIAVKEYSLLNINDEATRYKHQINVSRFDY